MAEFDTATAKGFRDEADLDPETEAAGFLQILAARRNAYAGVRAMELVQIGAEDGSLAGKRERLEARAWFDAALEGDAERIEFFRRVAGQLSPAAYRAHPVLNQLWSRHMCGATPPEGFDPAQAGSDEPESTLDLRQVGDELLAIPSSGDPDPAAPQGSFLCMARYSHPEVAVVTGTRTEEIVFPDWATQGGRDNFGYWAEFVVGDVTQRLRWIPPGRFMMGSPGEEEGRFDDEPQHEEIVAEGFWLFDTPCTQDLWVAVMGDNPSHFQGGELPVERISWKDCQKFCERLNALVSGFRASLPREAEWEYACRAGSTTARYGELDAIAWFSGNSGNHTHPVGEKEPNAWGLYDTLGNVREWCEDQWEAKGTGSSAYRVIRGGSWARVARHVRAAFRDWDRPGNRVLNLGFRCASSGGEPWQAKSEGAGAPRRSRRESGEGSDAKTDWLVPATSGIDLVPMPDGAATIQIVSDRERITLMRETRPGWARAMGRDRHGLWAELQVGEEESQAVVQKLRWIPPGRFLMGSPEDEEGRDSDEVQHEEIVEKGFWLFDTPCTQALWKKVMGDNPSRFKGDQLPVERVSWEDCQRFFARLNGRIKGLNLSLPGEAQWEYACRAGSTTVRYGELDAIAWYNGNSRSHTHPVGEKEPNAWGLYDVLGNVWEWCGEQWDAKNASASAGRVFRGGSWAGGARRVRAALRNWLRPGIASRYLGFSLCQFRP